MNALGTPLVDVRGLDIRFGRATAVTGLDFALRRGECVAFVGESGAGKSVSARALVGLAGEGAAVSAESFALFGDDALGFDQKRWRSLRGARLGLVLQDALTSLDPLRTIGAEVGESVRAHRKLRGKELRQEVDRLLRAAGITDPEVRSRQRAFQLSGGLRQRALIASAIANDPDVIIADEPTTALDVSVQAQILALFAEMKARGSGIVLVSHDLAVVAQLADRIHVLSAGRVIEAGDAADVLQNPQHPDTKRLLQSIPSASTRGVRLGRPDGRPSPAASAAPVADTAGTAVLEVRGLSMSFSLPQGGVRAAVRDLSFRLGPEEILGVVGESGSGKTTLARILLGHEQPDSGTVEVLGAPWSPAPERVRRGRRSRLQHITQDPLGSFDPRQSVRSILREAIRFRTEPGPTPESLIQTVHLSPHALDRSPRTLSGGERQRVAIARALATSPDILICDEPVSALDVSIQAEILDLLADLRSSEHMAVVFISHDLGVIQHLCDRVLVMRSGEVVESGPLDDVFRSPSHPYTRQLIAAIPTIPSSPSRGH